MTLLFVLAYSHHSKNSQRCWGKIFCVYLVIFTSSDPRLFDDGKKKKKIKKNMFYEWKFMFQS